MGRRNKRGERKSWFGLFFFIIVIPFCWVFLHTHLRCDFHIISSVSRHQQPSEGNNFLLSNFVTVLEG